jgi:hypothetical protein
MNKLVYIYVPNEFVIGYVLLTLLIKRLAVAMVNKTVVSWKTWTNRRQHNCVELSRSCTRAPCECEAVLSQIILPFPHILTCISVVTVDLLESRQSAYEHLILLNDDTYSSEVISCVYTMIYLISVYPLYRRFSRTLKQYAHTYTWYFRKF